MRFRLTKAITTSNPSEDLRGRLRWPLNARQQNAKRIMVASQIEFFDVRESMAQSLSREVFSNC